MLQLFECLGNKLNIFEFDLGIQQVANKGIISPSAHINRSTTELSR